MSSSRTLRILLNVREYMDMTMTILSSSNSFAWLLAECASIKSIKLHDVLYRGTSWKISCNTDRKSMKSNWLERGWRDYFNTCMQKQYLSMCYSREPTDQVFTYLYFPCWSEIQLLAWTKLTCTACCDQTKVLLRWCFLVFSFIGKYAGICKGLLILCNKGNGIPHIVWKFVYHQKYWPDFICSRLEERTNTIRVDSKWYTAWSARRPIIL